MRILRLVTALSLATAALVTLAPAPAAPASAKVSGVTSLAAGANHTCAVRATQVLCWGDNSFGQLGDATTELRRRPVLTVALGAADTVVAGAFHTCALRNGAPWCWGANNRGQLGIGSMTMSSVPVALGIDGISFIAAGAESTCAVIGPSREVFCWGANDRGQLGDGTTTDRTAPVPTGLTGVTALALSSDAACALKDDASVFCWGANALGQLGNGSTADSSVPVRALVTGVSLLAASHSDTRFCAATPAIVCWGYDAGAPVTSPTPVPSTPGFNGKLTSLVMGAGHTCALRDVEVLCWGASAYGQVASRARDGVPAPTRVTALRGATALAAGANHTCALRTRLVLCVGDDAFGQLARGVELYSTRPVLTATGATALARSCALVRNRHLCWGENITGALPTPTSFENAPVAPFGNLRFDRLASGPNNGCGVTSGALRCWGSWLSAADWSTPVIMPVHLRPSMPGYSTLDGAVGAWHACGIRSDRTVWCGGLNSSGQLGNGTTTSTYTSVQAIGVTGATAIAAAGGTTCAISSGTLRCWGENSSGQLGNGTTTGSATPAVVPGFASGTSHVAVGENHVCAARNGQVWCWGQNVSGQLGDGTTTMRTSPALVAGVTNAQQIAIGTAHTCVRSATARTGALWCWGANSHGQLGMGTATQLRPVLVGSMAQGVTAVSATDRATCAVRTASVFCWGDRTEGRLGDRLGSSTDVPVLSLR